MAQRETQPSLRDVGAGPDGGMQAETCSRQARGGRGRDVCKGLPLHRCDGSTCERMPRRPPCHRDSHKGWSGSNPGAHHSMQYGRPLGSHGLHPFRHQRESVIGYRESKPRGSINSSRSSTREDHFLAGSSATPEPSSLEPRLVGMIVGASDRRIINDLVTLAKIK